MHLHFRNVNEAFEMLVRSIYKKRIPTRTSSSRVGDVIVVDDPVTVTYNQPRERVLFNRARDCNPFFHLFEALWMLAGRNDVAPLVYYNPQMKEYSDDGETLHGAYGYRWRHRFGWDQLMGIVRELTDNPNSRRCVLSIWNSCFHDDDKAGGEEDMEMVLQGSAKDVPCNTHAYFSIRTVRGSRSGAVVEPYETKHLDMTVCNRSNDMIWGMLGANVVHFSILQEYMAARIGVEVGVYHQFTNNLHVYTERWEPEEWLAEYTSTAPGPPLPVYDGGLRPYPRLAPHPDVFDEECARFIDCIDGNFTEPFLCNTAQPMMAAFRAHKQRRYHGDNNALMIMDRVWSSDWRIAGTNWIRKRQEAWERKSRVEIGSERNPYTSRELDRQTEEAGTN